MLPRPRSHYVGLSRQPHCAVVGANKAHRWPATILPTMSQVWNPLEPFQVCFSCPNGSSPRVHRVTQRNDHWSPEIPNDFPSNVTPLSDDSTTCNIVFSFFVLHIFQKWVLCPVSPHGSRWILPHTGTLDLLMEWVDGLQTLPRLHGSSTPHRMIWSISMGYMWVVLPTTRLCVMVSTASWPPLFN